jgi:hypothetical protein
MELHFVIGEERTGKSFFIENYDKREKTNSHKHYIYKHPTPIRYDTDTKIFNLGKIPKNKNVFAEFRLELLDNDRRYFRYDDQKMKEEFDLFIQKLFSIDGIYENFQDAKEFKPEEIFVHFFYKNYNSNFDIEKEAIHNVIVHNPLPIMNPDYHYSFCVINEIERSENFDWSIMNTRQYCLFKLKHNLEDFVLLNRKKFDFEERKYLADYSDDYWERSDNGSEIYVNTNVEDLLMSLKNENLVDCSYFQGRRLERSLEENYAVVHYDGHDYYDRWKCTDTYISIPCLYKILSEENFI